MHDMILYRYVLRSFMQLYKEHMEVFPSAATVLCMEASICLQQLRHLIGWHLWRRLI